jgi:sugar phosphate isomerase/epimerase
MKTQNLSRRAALTRAGLVVGAAFAGRNVTAAAASAEAATAKNSPFLFCLNTATIRGQKVGLIKEIEIAAQAGYAGIEPWIGTIDDYKKAGGSLKDARKRLDDLGLTVQSAIGFSEWIVDDDAKRAKGMERARYELDLVAQLGGKRLAAPPSGATNTPGLDLLLAADRYRALLELGDQAGVVPQLELWGHSKNFYRLGQCVCTAIETGHPKACVLADIFHLYKGGSDFHGLKLLGENTVQVLHVNDYPSEPPRDKINDGFRVYPGDGSGPVAEIMRLLHATGGQKVLSLEVFNKKYSEQDPLEVARTGLEKMKSVAAKALA